MTGPPTSWLQNLGMAIEIACPTLALITTISRLYIRVDTKTLGWAIGSVICMKELYIGIHYWDVPLPMNPTTGMIWIYIVGAVYNPILCTDLIAVGLPFYIFLGLKMQKKRKIGLMIVFMLGIMSLKSSKDQDYDNQKYHTGQQEWVRTGDGHEGASSAANGDISLRSINNRHAKTEVRSSASFAQDSDEELMKVNGSLVKAKADVILRATWRHRVSFFGLIVAAGVSAFLTEEFPWQPPGPGDLRSPCLGINTLVNHGLLPRDGRNIDLEVLGEATALGYNMEHNTMLAVSIPAFTTLTTGNSSTFHLSDVDQHVPQVIEHDGSITRDKYFGDSNSFSHAAWGRALASWGDNEIIDFAAAASEIKARFE
ncbi:hypothetical protein CSAL01_06494 [Colletotrichum salicis]|uniref:Heme haloperoxidase family profile domain-containing protein n=1 Tax=Colletotrichum salicis TaxID=1209931 RepID=A0A135V304_9PEZI|nr:hypothetical protein CSAL01_06494 [Colletotrichum salicis]